VKIGKHRDTGNDGTEVDDPKHLEFDPFKDVEGLPPIPAAADGGPNMVGYVGDVDPIPAATPENFICLAGPCKHYMEVHSLADVETRGHNGPPKYINRLCRALPGVEIDLTEDCVFSCSEWAPLLPEERLDIEERRQAFRQLVMATRKEKRA
jgi:hypothetical protein